MYTRQPAKSFIAMMLVIAFTTTCLQAPAYAAMLSNQDIAAQQSLQAERDQLRERVMRDEVKSQMVSMGVDPVDVENRINKLTSSEISQINGNLDSLPAGGNVLGTIALVLIILILLEITGSIDIFPRI